MGCQYPLHDYYGLTGQGAGTFTVAMPKLTFGRGSLHETGPRAASHGLKRPALFTDAALAAGPLVAMALESCRAAGMEVHVYHDIRIEPCDDTVRRAAAFLRDTGADGVISVGGGSVIDTAKAALLMAAWPGDIVDYFAAPVGQGKPVPGPVMPHVACPTTSGTGSECTSISVLRINALNCKFVMANPYLLPIEAIVDPACCDSLPGNVVASTGFDLCCHALECYTARAYTEHRRIGNPQARSYIQGTNPFSEIAAREALSIVNRYLVRGVTDARDHVARDRLMWGATLAGIAFGNSGTHLPHAMSYGITHLTKNVSTPGYTTPAPFVPHGISVVVNAPAIFAYTAEATPERHMEGAEFLGADTVGAANDDAGEVLGNRLMSLMRETGMPNGLQDLGYAENDVQALAASSIRQGRAIANAPRESNQGDLENLYRAAMRYW